MRVALETHSVTSWLWLLHSITSCLDPRLVLDTWTLVSQKEPQEFSDLESFSFWLISHPNWFQQRKIKMESLHLVSSLMFDTEELKYFSSVFKETVEDKRYFYYNQSLQFSHLQHLLYLPFIWHEQFFWVLWNSDWICLTVKSLLGRF